MNPAHGLYSIHRKFQIEAFHSATDSHRHPDFIFYGEVHDYWELLCVVEGTVDVTQNDRVYRLNAGDMILHGPMKFHSLHGVEHSGCHMLITTFSVSGRLPAKLGEGFFSLSPEELQDFQQLFLRIYHFVRGTNEALYAGQECADTLASFLISLINHHAVCDESFQTPDTRLFQRLAALMNASVCSNLTVEAIADQVPISASYMKVLFHRYAGMAPKQYYSRLRLAEAIRLMQTGLTAAETADRMQFSSPNYFSYFFKKMTGQPPSVYMNRYD